MKNNAILIIILIFFSTRISVASIVIVNGLTQTINLESGKEISGKIIIRNESAKSSRVKIYKQDIFAACGQNINYAEIGTNPRSLGTWLKTGVDEKLLEPREEYALYYTVTVPASAVASGTYWTVIMVEGLEPIKVEESEGVKVNSVVRYAIQIVGDLGKLDSPKLVFEDIKYDGTVNAKNLQFRIKNEGEFSAKTKIILEIYGATGEKLKTIEGLSKRIYPHLCNEFQIELADLQKGKYECVAIADNGKDLFGANVSIEIE